MMLVLPAPDGPDQRHRLARRDVRSTSSSAGSSGRDGVGKAHPSKHDPAPHRRAAPAGRGGVGHRHPRPATDRPAVRWRPRRAATRPRSPTARPRPRHHHRVDHELHQAAGRHVARAHVAAPIHSTPTMPVNTRKITITVITARGVHPAARGVIAFLGHVGKGARALGPSWVKACTVCTAGQRLGGAAGTGRDPVLVLAAEHPQPPPQHEDRHDHQRHDQQHQPGQLGRGRQHQRSARR